MLAATNVAGRKLYSSYLTISELLSTCLERGVEEYDLMGIDPHKNPGVYNFKKGTGAEPLEYLGEWEWATSEPLYYIANWAMGKRKGAM